MNELLTRVLVGGISGVLFLGVYVAQKHLFSAILLAVFFVIVLFEWPKLCKGNKSLWLLVPFYPFLPILSLVYLNHVHRAPVFLFPLYPFFISWIADTLGYVFGTLWGRHKVWPAISPKKSWEGLLGSFLGVLVFVFFCFTSHLLFAPLLAGIFTFAAFAGDLFESYLKRRAGLKDTGTILPGHGGLLDRFDSVFFVGPIILMILYVSRV